MIRKLVLAATMAATAFAVSTAANAGEPVRIGVALSQTGNLADSAAPYFKGLDLWREQANARGGLATRPIEFVVYDDRSDPATAARLYERLITSDKVDFVISSLGSATAATGSAVAEKHKVVMINGGLFPHKHSFRNSTLSLALQWENYTRTYFSSRRELQRRDSSHGVSAKDTKNAGSTPATKPTSPPR